MSVDKVYEIEEKCQSCKENEALFDLQWKRSMEATKLWQKENDPEIWPNLGKLLEWLMDKAGMEYEKV